MASTIRCCSTSRCPASRCRRWDLTIPVLISGARISQTFRFTMSEAQFRMFIEGRVDNMRNMVMSLSIMNPREPPPPEAGREREARMVVADEATGFFHQIADVADPELAGNVATVMWADIFQKYLATVLWLDFYEQRDPRHEILTQTTSDVIVLILGRIVIDKSSDREPPDQPRDEHREGGQQRHVGVHDHRRADRGGVLPPHGDGRGRGCATDRRVRVARGCLPARSCSAPGAVGAASSAALATYNRFDLDLAAVVVAFLDGAIDEHRALGVADIENEMLSLKAQYVSAQRGVQPLTLERVTTHRRDMERSISLRVLLKSAQRLRDELGRDRQSLDDGRAQLRPIVLSVIHKGLAPALPQPSITQQEIDALWTAVLNDAELQLAARQLAMQLSLVDIQLLLAELLS